MATLGVYSEAARGGAGAGSWIAPVASLTGLLLAARRLANMMMTPVAGHLLDRLDDRRIIAAAGVLNLLAGFLVLMGGRRVGLVVVGVVLVALGEGFSQPALVVWTGDGAPVHVRGVVMGGLSTASDLGAALGPRLSLKAAGRWQCSRPRCS